MADEIIQPINRFSQKLACPPDKSISHRAVMFGAAAKGKSEVRGLLMGADCLSTVDCVKRLGAEVEINGDTAVVTGTGKFRSADLYAGNSGTTMRMLCGLLAPRGGSWTLSGDDSLSARPMNRVIMPLSEMGAKISSRDGRAPLGIEGAKLHGIDYVMPVASAQVKSAIILAALGASGTTHITERERTRDHTEIMLSQMGASIARDGDVISVVGGQTLSPLSADVTGDISGAAFSLVLGLITGGTVTVTNVGLNPTRVGLIEVFDMIGVDYSIDDERTVCGEKTGTVTVRGLGDGRGYKIDGGMIPRLVDEIPILAVLACYLGGDSEISGAQELRVKESDRIAATLRLVRSFGGEAEETESGMIIRPVGKLRGGCVFDPMGDHRMAMSAAVAAAASERGATVLGGECAAVSYPDFWRVMFGRS